jgi:outer membrane protein insertion porin family
VEGQTGSIILGAGVASDSGLVGQIIFDQRNFDIMDWPESTHDLLFGEAFRGAGQRFRISINPGTVQSTFSVSFSEPYLYNKPVSLDVVASGFNRGRESYDEDRLKGYVGFEKRYPDDWRRGISFRVENVDVTDLEVDAPKEIVDIKGDNGLLGVRFFIRKDTTDLRFTPSRGYNFNAGYEQVGGDHTFGRLDATQRWYTTLHEDLAERKTILETKIQAATVVGDAPAFEKFYGGGTGAYSIRGFDYRGVSTRGLQRGVVPARRKDPIGSDWIIVGNAEVAVPLTTEIFSWLFFVDAGAIDTGGVRASVGTGIQILLPQWFGPVPMRFELAAPFMKDDEDDTRVFSFSIGALF